MGFWAAILCPMLYLSLLITGIEPRPGFHLFIALVGFHLIALFIGRNHRGDRIQ